MKKALHEYSDKHSHFGDPYICSITEREWQMIVRVMQYVHREQRAHIQFVIRCSNDEDWRNMMERHFNETE